MKKLFGSKKKKEKQPPVTIEEATEKINRRGDVADEKIKKLDAELLLFKEQIKKAKPGPAQDLLKARALRVLKQKKMYEAQRDMLYNQSFKLERVTFATEGIKDARETMAAMKAGSKDLEGTLKVLKIDDVDKLQDVITSIVEESNEIQDSLIQGHSAPDHLDEDDLIGELDALESDAKTQKRTEVDAVVQPIIQASSPEVQMPSAPRRHTSISAAGMPHQSSQASPDEPESPALQVHPPALPRSSIQT